ncbi:MAG: hypothetical protein Q9166_000451 [cf. Caloplaca sp. 2 TL-2023]
MLSPDNLTPQTRLLLAMLSCLQNSQSSPPISPPPPYTFATPTFTVNTSLNTKPPVSDVTDDDEFDPEDSYPKPPVHIHISAPTTVTGSNNRLVLPSPTHLSSLVSIAVKHALSGEEGEVKEGGQSMAVTVDAGTKIEGHGNVMIYHGRKDSVGSTCSSGSVREETAMKECGRKRRATSEPADTQKVMKRVKN